MSHGAATKLVGIPEITDVEFVKVARLVHDVTGIVLDDTRRALVVGRLRKRLAAHGLRSFREYLRHLEQRDPDGHELRQLVNSITTNKTSFFREPHHFSFLRQAILERRARATRDPSLRRVRIWSAGCATGEEPYTIAMTLLEVLGPELGSWDVKILATDIDTDVLAFAERGVYPRDRMAGVPLTTRGLAFEDSPEGPRVRKELRDLVSFNVLNFMDETWPMKGAFDFLFCRNVTIYFDRPTQDRLYRRFASLLARDGCFFAGHSENLTWLSDIFTLRATAVYAHTRVSGVVPVAATRAASPPPLPRDPQAKRPGAHETIPEKAVVAGAVGTSRTPMVLKTVLGSCVAVCLYDPVARIGGMNHFMLPGADRYELDSPRFGIHAMELLINELLHLGAERPRLVAKIAGGCRVVGTDAGAAVAAKNVAFIEEFLTLEGFPILSRRVGGDRAIEIRFRTDTGEAFVRTVDSKATSRVVEEERAASITPAPPSDPDDGITWFK